MHANLLDQSRLSSFGRTSSTEVLCCLRFSSVCDLPQLRLLRCSSYRHCKYGEVVSFDILRPFASEHIANPYCVMLRFLALLCIVALSDLADPKTQRQMQYRDVPYLRSEIVSTIRTHKEIERKGEASGLSDELHAKPSSASSCLRNL